MTVRSAITPLSAPLQRDRRSTVRCGRCGAAQQVDLRQSVLTQVRPFVHAHLECGADLLEGSEGSDGG